MKSVMKHSFSAVPAPKVQRSTFNRSHGYKTTFNGGDIVPFYCDEVLPGDSFSLNTHHFARLATPIAPFMDNARLTFFYFFVPTRLVWSNFKKFMGEQANPNSTTDYLIPTIQNTPLYSSSARLFDYFGIMNLNKTLPSSNFGYPSNSINSLPFRAYNLIWNEWFRDQNLQDSLPLPMGDGPDLPDNFGIVKRNKRHDYFTSALPWPQKGDPVGFNLGTFTGELDDGSVTGNGYTPLFTDGTIGPRYGSLGASSHELSIIDKTAGTVTGELSFIGDIGELNSKSVTISDSISITVNAMREAFQLQKMLERDARGGTRYTEIVLSHFGVQSPDARLQRPEYLGGGSSFVNISPVAQQSSTDTVSPQGNLAAFGTTSGRSGFRKSFTEHGYIIGLVCATADLTYQQGINRMWTRRTRYDFYWPALAHLGEQPVYNYEIYNAALSTDESLDKGIFGYQERYAEYRYKPSLITGMFNSTYTGNLDVWHLSQEFESKPNLNSAFITENPPFKRVSAVPSEPDFILDMYLNLHCARPMPVYSVPGLIDHF